MITPQELYDKTNKGLDIILYYYPQAQTALDEKKPFSIRDERTPSAHIKEVKGLYRVTDFGDDQTAKSPIDIAMLHENKTFVETMLILASRYGIENNYRPEINKPDIRQRDATGEEKEGAFTFELNETISEKELQTLGPKVTEKHCKAYGYYSVKSYTKIKDRKATTIISNENYPIFLRECYYDEKGIRITKRLWKILK